ncbi:MAG: GTP cyclohydrolase I FolE2, partial [Deltaproteobacteria bacterium]|nr:GTP cyclohydrolase I FolE2 [Deltaproteobacteria bacterium]
MNKKAPSPLPLRGRKAAVTPKAGRRLRPARGSPRLRREASKGLRDVQGEPDLRRIDIDKVGVKDIRYPIVVLDKRNKLQH